MHSAMVAAQLSVDVITESFMFGYFVKTALKFAALRRALSFPEKHNESYFRSKEDMLMKIPCVGMALIK